MLWSQVFCAPYSKESDAHSSLPTTWVSVAPCSGPTRVSLSGVYHHIDPKFKCWNVDPSENREWESRNLSRLAPGGEKLYALARASRPGYLRFGGGGADTFAYNIPGAPAPYLNCSALPELGRAQLGKQPPHCLNSTWLLNLLDFADSSGASLIFGLDINARTAGDKWDPTPAKALIQFATSHGHNVFGFVALHTSPQQWRTTWRPCCCSSKPAPCTWPLP